MTKPIVRARLQLELFTAVSLWSRTLVGPKWRRFDYHVFRKSGISFLNEDVE
jgi:hypothetical protein